MQFIRLNLLDLINYASFIKLALGGIYEKMFSLCFALFAANLVLGSCNGLWDVKKDVGIRLRIDTDHLDLGMSLFVRAAGGEAQFELIASVLDANTDEYAHMPNILAKKTILMQNRDNLIVDFENMPLDVTVYVNIAVSPISSYPAGKPAPSYFGNSDKFVLRAGTNLVRVKMEKYSYP